MYEIQIRFKTGIGYCYVLKHSKKDEQISILKTDMVFIHVFFEETMEPAGSKVYPPNDTLTGAGGFNF